MTPYALCGSFRAAAEQGDALTELLLEAAELLRQAESCLVYLVNRSPGDPDAVWVVEVWADAAAHRASLELATLQNIIARARPLIAAVENRFELQPVGGIGVTLPPFDPSGA